jgi:hypothetical protein
LDGPVFGDTQPNFPTISTPRESAMLDSVIPSKKSESRRFSLGVNHMQEEPSWATFRLGVDPIVEMPMPVVAESQSGKFLVSRGEQDRDDTLIPLKVWILCGWRCTDGRIERYSKTHAEIAWD